MVQPIAITDFFRLQPSVPLIDVRTPAEFMQGHIPAAFNIPLFTNEERVAVGTAYKQKGRESAILLGFDLTGSKWSGFIKQALVIAPDKKIAVHCWRGGMRSGAMAWALNLYGFQVYVIIGGYKTYRTWALKKFNDRFFIKVLGGMTGSGKTQTLHQLKSLDEQVIDLEDLAQHQGSSYGSMNCMLQPSQEQFENDFAFQLQQFDATKPIWVEDESLTIGKRCIPHGFWNQMRQATLIFLDIPLNQRIENLVTQYGPLDKDFLITRTERIHKRLGPEQTKQAIEAIKENRMADFVRFVLVYYDKTYRNGLSKREKDSIHNFRSSTHTTAVDIKRLLEFSTPVRLGYINT